MLILLAPSEGKSSAASGPPLDLAALSHAAALTATRTRVLDALIRLSGARSRKRALDALGLSKGQAGELERNAALLHAPTAPAAEVYTGVLYQHLALAELGKRARARAGDSVLVASALFGVVALDDRIPAYRLSMGATLPALRATLAATWKPVLAKALPDEGLVVDLRSGGYAAAWQPRSATVVAVRAFTESAGGVRKPLSHMATATRGDVARLVVSARSDPKDPAALAALVEKSGLAVELGRPAKAGAPWTLDVIVPSS